MEVDRLTETYSLNTQIANSCFVFFFQLLPGPPSVMVLSFNDTGTQMTEFLMICFPGMQNTQHWFHVILILLLILALEANFVALLAIWQEASLHKPMYYLFVILSKLDVILSMLDVILCFTVIPKVSLSSNKFSGT